MVELVVNRTFVHAICEEDRQTRLLALPRSKSASAELRENRRRALTGGEEEAHRKRGSAQSEPTPQAISAAADAKQVDPRDGSPDEATGAEGGRKVVRVAVPRAGEERAAPEAAESTGEKGSTSICQLRQLQERLRVACSPTGKVSSLSALVAKPPWERDQRRSSASNASTMMGSDDEGEAPIRSRPIRKAFSSSSVYSLASTMESLDMSLTNTGTLRQAFSSSSVNSLASTMESLDRSLTNTGMQSVLSSGSVNTLSSIQDLDAPEDQPEPNQFEFEMSIEETPTSPMHRMRRSMSFGDRDAVQLTRTQDSASNSTNKRANRRRRMDGGLPNLRRGWRTPDPSPTRSAVLQAVDEEPAAEAPQAPAKEWAAAVAGPADDSLADDALTPPWRSPKGKQAPKHLNLAEEFERSRGGNPARASVSGVSAPGACASDTSSAVPVTTLMIRNVPYRYTQHELIAELEVLGFSGAFDFLYLPLDTETMSNMGYAFVNFINESLASAALQSIPEHKFKLPKRGCSGKTAGVSVAYIQGLEKNLQHYKDAAVNAASIKQRRPVVVANISKMLDGKA